MAKKKSPEMNKFLWSMSHNFNFNFFFVEGLKIVFENELLDFQINDGLLLLLSGFFVDNNQLI